MRNARFRGDKKDSPVDNGRAVVSRPFAIVISRPFAIDISRPCKIILRRWYHPRGVSLRQDWRRPSVESAVYLTASYLPKRGWTRYFRHKSMLQAA